ncbi:ATP-binding protein [Deinococcus roseus]|uniref:ATPase n=1 Tax=Deinococcus roseus TaxID=392414 RepID=A0ABQ2DFN2_9DEIO|nr:ATP-binding protein [Deinococcus roseus]GGJ56408.1 ATPase [Deinococcus roseus]
MTLVNAEPRKKFFTEMLTRDIDLKDAILDLLDNCIDGALRASESLQINAQVQQGDSEVVLVGNTAEIDPVSPYSDRWAEISINETEFVIRDNCGGIPRDIAINYAFRMGRSEEMQETETVKSVGVYGIGMKRAVFKMGRNVEVISKNAEDFYRVCIPPAWMSSGDWSLELEDLPNADLFTGNTLVYVNDLHEEIIDLFNNTDFIDDLKTTISTHYSVIISKGFEIRFIYNEELEIIVAREIKISYKSPSTEDPVSSILPYIVTGKTENVDYSIIVGFYAPPPGIEEDEGEDQPNWRNIRKSEYAGWTIICNDRVVIYNDKSIITGWGEAMVPTYHNQFRAISGVVEFSSRDLKKLPWTTTKRGINTNSRVYLEAKNYMRNGMKKFTDFTNHWKRNQEEARSLFKGHRPTVYKEVIKELKKDTEIWTRSRRDDTLRYDIPLPRPEETNKMIVIRFSKPKDLYNEVKYKLFEDDQISPSALGEFCFDYFLKGDEDGGR